LLGAQILKVGPRHRRQDETAAGDRHDLVGTRHAEGSPEQRPHGGVDRRRHTNAERQRDHREDGEPRGQAQTPQRQQDIPHEWLHDAKLTLTARYNPDVQCHTR
jgi:hypothetical protein